MTPRDKYYEALGSKMLENFAKRGMEAYYCASKEEALKKALELIPENSSVSWGGSMTIGEIGLDEKLKGGKYNVIDRTLAKNNEEKNEMYRKAFFCDWYIGSANGVSSKGEIVNIDGTGNRVAAMMYGPDNVLLIVGMNKVSPNLEEAVSRARNVAAPINTARFGKQTPCSKTGSCMDCFSDDCICSYITITRKSNIKGRIKVILVAEELGY